MGIAIQNPVGVILKPIMPPGRDRVMSQTEELRLLEEIPPIVRRNSLMQPLVILALETEIRRGEMLGMRWKHVDLERRAVFLSLTKNGTSRHAAFKSSN